MPQRGNANLLEILIRQLLEDLKIDVVFGKALPAR